MRFVKKRAVLTMPRRNYYEKAFALRNGNKLFCCPSVYRTRAIGLRWFLGPRLRDATRRMRSCLQLHRQCFQRSCDASQPREVQRIRREIRRGSRFGDRSRQTRLGLRQTLQHLWPRDMERLRRKCAMLGLLDRATKLTSSQGENREYLDRRLKPQALLAGAIAL